MDEDKLTTAAEAEVDDQPTVDADRQAEDGPELDEDGLVWIAQVSWGTGFDADALAYGRTPTAALEELLECLEASWQDMRTNVDEA